MHDSTTALGGVARDAAGKLADMPRDEAHRINDQLLDVVTLLRCALNEIDVLQAHSNEPQEADELTGYGSRAVSLVVMADSKVRGIIEGMSPYV